MAQIKYHTKVKLVTRSLFDEEIKYKQVLIVREPPANFNVGINQHNECKITTWCCLDQGVSRMWGQFEKNIYEPSENVKADAILDNKDCRIAITNVRLAVEEELVLNCGGHTYRELITLTERAEGGVPPGNQ